MPDLAVHSEVLCAWRLTALDAQRQLDVFAGRERELMAALRALRLDIQNAEGLNEGLRQMWIATVDRVVAPDAAGQREAP